MVSLKEKLFERDKCIFSGKENVKHINGDYKPDCSKCKGYDEKCDLEGSYRPSKDYEIIDRIVDKIIGDIKNEK